MWREKDLESHLEILGPKWISMGAEDPAVAVVLKSGV